MPDFKDKLSAARDAVLDQYEYKNTIVDDAVAVTQKRVADIQSKSITGKLWDAAKMLTGVGAVEQTAQSASDAVNIRNARAKAAKQKKQAGEFLDKLEDNPDLEKLWKKTAELDGNDNGVSFNKALKELVDAQRSREETLEENPKMKRDKDLGEELKSRLKYMLERAETDLERKNRARSEATELNAPRMTAMAATERNLGGFSPAAGTDGSPGERSLT